MIENMIRESVRRKKALKKATFSSADLKKLRKRTEQEIVELEGQVEEKQEILREIQCICKHDGDKITHTGGGGDAYECVICGDIED